MSKFLNSPSRFTSFGGALATVTLMGCSGAYIAVGDSAKGDVRADGGSALDAATTDPNLDARALACVEPEPNDEPKDAPTLPENFLCGSVSKDDFDVFNSTAKEGDLFVRFDSASSTATLAVLSIVDGGYNPVGEISSGDAFALVFGKSYVFGVSTTSSAATSYSILIARR
jgi:hypothetical protein